MSKKVLIVSACFAVIVGVFGLVYALPGLSKPKDTVKTNQTSPIKVTYSSYQSTENYDNSDKTITNSTDLEQLQNKLNEYAINATGPKTKIDNEGCSGGLRINMAIEYKDGHTDNIRLYRCGGKIFSDSTTGNLSAFFDYFKNEFIR